MFFWTKRELGHSSYNSVHVVFIFFLCDSGCEECNSANPSVCLKHGPLHPIPNRPVVSKARASLPLVLFVDRFLGGVFAKRRIPKRTQFGPVEAPLVPQSELQEHYIHLKVNKIHLQQKEASLWSDLKFEFAVSVCLCNPFFPPPFVDSAVHAGCREGCREVRRLVVGPVR